MIHLDLLQRESREKVPKNNGLIVDGRYGPTTAKKLTEMVNGEVRRENWDLLN